MITMSYHFILTDLITTLKWQLSADVARKLTAMLIAARPMFLVCRRRRKRDP